VLRDHHGSGLDDEHLLAGLPLAKEDLARVELSAKADEERVGHDGRPFWRGAQDGIESRQLTVMLLPKSKTPDLASMTTTRRSRDAYRVHDAG